MTQISGLGLSSAPSSAGCYAIRLSSLEHKPVQHITTLPPSIRADVDVVDVLWFRRSFFHYFIDVGVILLYSSERFFRLPAALRRTTRQWLSRLPSIS